VLVVLLGVAVIVVGGQKSVDAEPRHGAFWEQCAIV
jgi:hypothetical protein